MAAPDLTVWPKLVELATCLGTEITRWGLPEPCVCSVLPGAIVALDYCAPCSGDKCGMAWVRLAEMFPSANFPNQDTSLRSCSSALAYSVELGIARCAPVGTDDGEPPPWEDTMAVAQLQAGDALAMRSALQCCYGKTGWVLGAYRPAGPEGGCVWGTWTAWVS